MFTPLQKNITSIYSDILRVGARRAVQSIDIIKKHLLVLHLNATLIPNASIDQLKEIDDELNSIAEFVDTWVKKEFEESSWEHFIKMLSETVDRLLKAIEQGKLLQE